MCGVRGCGAVKPPSRGAMRSRARDSHGMTSSWSWSWSWPPCTQCTTTRPPPASSLSLSTFSIALILLSNSKRAHSQHWSSDGGGGVPACVCAQSFRNAKSPNALRWRQSRAIVSAAESIFTPTVNPHALSERDKTVGLLL